MAPKTSEQNLEIREFKRKLIMDSACDLFANHGFFDTSISRIAKKAGISKGLIYNYFDSKEQLLKALVLEGLETFYENFDQNNDGILTREAFEFYITRYFSLLQENKKFWKLYFAIVIQPPVLQLLDEDLRKFGAPMVQTMFKYFEDNGYDDPATELAFFSALLSGLAIKYLNAPEYFDLEKLKSKIFSIYHIK